VPEISRFFGIVVFMNYNDHPPPHVMEWAATHRQELLGGLEPCAAAATAEAHRAFGVVPCWGTLFPFSRFPGIDFV